MPDRVEDWVELVAAAYPVADAQPWDNVGLQIGDPADPVAAVLVCLDVTAETLDEAAARGAQLLLAHHPLLFRPLERLTPATAPGRLALRAARAGVAVVAAHTNLDAAADGTTEPIMRALGITDSSPLEPVSPTAFSKIVVFVPVEKTQAVLTAAFAAGAGGIGAYDECSFRVTGTGTFRPSAQANPAIGEREQRNEVAEDRVEVVVPTTRARAVAGAIEQAHPYEEVALDVHNLAAVGGAAPAKGVGRGGELDQPLPLREVAARLRDRLPSPLLRTAGDPERVIQRVAACGGAGDSLIGAALASGADLYVTGDLRHHVTLDALTMGMAMIDAGHYAPEAAALPALIRRLTEAAVERGLQARLLPSELSTDPWLVDQEERQR
jgi:dinuclear metal center YbgI/SA1388 family protein